LKLFIERLKVLFYSSDLLWQLVERDLKLKYRRSFLGYIWSVLNPLGIMLVMTAVFSSLFRFDVLYYPAYLIAGQILFNFMMESTNQSMFSIVGGASLLKKTYIPKYILTVSKVTSSIINLTFALVALLGVILVVRVPFTPFMLLFPVVLLQLYFFSMGLSLFLAQATVFFRDIQYIYAVITTAWLYMTPIFYPIEMLRDKPVGWIVENLNPMYFYVTQFRSVMLYGALPPTDIVLKGGAAAALMLVIGVQSFYKNQDRFILYI
jgi:lipopolysaccharide transport system permease protein